ncbi:pre-mRNA-splicing factor ATP-dependent RNA helicase prp43 [Fusarium acutatum]|uniref:Pre-mRNA-splicing factor ATP-dependent RNA helicase prp43 n=1 Tax=Fusarium acutatum TaxID=78861 RepID=A0A8H4JTI8_9HYPO|nr:pre-mRNA-splicing factor ATP-dependent RNA helicase prp43 [Fusarium acutatum]
MPSSIDADTDQVVEVTQVSVVGNEITSISYQVNHAADAVPKSTSTPDRVVDDGGEIQVRPEAIRRIIGVYVEHLAAYESDGWVQWFPRARPTVPPMDEDHRMVEEINDVLTPDVPYKDTANVIAREIELSRAGDKMAGVEGPMLGGKIRFRVRQLSALNSVEDNRTKFTLLENFIKKGQIKSMIELDDEYSENIRRSRLPRFFNEAAKLEPSRYTPDKCRIVHDNYPFVFDPNSGLVGMDHEWVICHKMHYNGVQYLDMATVGKPEWLIKYSFLNDNRLPDCGV